MKVIKTILVNYYDKYDFNAPFASGSAQYNIMLLFHAAWAR